jgi:hypothetical protein
MNFEQNRRIFFRDDARKNIIGLIRYVSSNYLLVSSGQFRDFGQKYGSHHLVVVLAFASGGEFGSRILLAGDADFRQSSLIGVQTEIAPTRNSAQEEIYYFVLNTFLVSNNRILCVRHFFSLLLERAILVRYLLSERS